jgi:sulfofructose kinase
LGLQIGFGDYEQVGVSTQSILSTTSTVFTMSTQHSALSTRHSTQHSALSTQHSPATQHFDVLGFGSVVVDDFLRVARYPDPDGKAEVLGKKRCLGGLVGTALVAASRLGARCAYAGVLGRDDLSMAVRNGLSAAGVDLSLMIEREGAEPIHSVIIAGDVTGDRPAGTRNIFFDASPFAFFDADRVTQELIARTRVVFVDQHGGDAATRALRLARQLGIPSVGDLESPHMPNHHEMLELVDHAIVPRDFALAVTGAQDAVAATRTLHQSHPRSATVVTDGAKGCHYCLGTAAADVRHLPATPVESVVETTGCGDVFHGAYAAWLAAGYAVPDCLRAATIAAAIYASRPSGWEYLPVKEEI